MKLDRRQFLKWSSAAPILAAAPQLMAAPQKLILPTESHRQLKLRNLHTGEKLNVTYWEQGEYLIDGLAEVYFLMRDHRQNSIAAIDLDLIDQLHSIQQTLNTQRDILLVSGFRSETTNHALRNTTGKATGVAKRSLHMQGRAMDFRIPGLNLRHVHKATLANAHGGVGYYARSGYLHMDTGRKRRWAM